MVLLDGKRLKRNKIGRLVTRKSSEEVSGWASQNEHRLKIIMLHVNTDQGKTTTVEALNNGQNNTIGGYVSFFPQPP